jgi:fibronectin-binding autotransporter adhesin
MTLSGDNSSYAGGITIKQGQLTISTVAGAAGAAGNTINLGDGAANATLQFQSTLTYTVGNINVVAGAGTRSIAGSTTTGDPVLDAAIVLNNDLRIIAGAAAATTDDFTFRGGMTGTGNLLLNYNATAHTGALTFSTNPVNISGTITNSGNTTGTTTFSGGIGSNVTLLDQNSITSAMTVSTTALSVNSGGTTLRNTLGTKLLTVSGGVTGTGDLNLDNDSATTSGVTLTTNAVNNTGVINNIGSGAGTVTITGGVGSNVTAVSLNSTTSALTISTNAITVNSGGTTLTNVLGTRVLTVSGGVTGTGNLIIDNDSGTAAGVTLTTNAVNNTGVINNTGAGAGSATITGGVGSNVTAINQNSTTSPLTISGTAISVNSTATTLTTASGGALFTVSSGTTGTGNLILNNNSATDSQLTLSTTSVNHTGNVTNSGTGIGATLVSAAIGSNVVDVTQNSATSALALTNASNAYTGNTTVTNGVLFLGASNVIPDGAGKGNVSIAGTGTLVIGTGFSETINGLSGTGVVDLLLGTTSTLTVGGNDQTSAFGGQFKNTTGTLNLTKIGNGTLTLTGLSTYSGTSTLNAGIVNLGVAENAGIEGPLGSATTAGSIVMGGATLQYSAANNFDYSSRFSTAANQVYKIDTNSQTVNFATELTSSGGTLTKLGAGTLELSGAVANTYTGLTTVTGGTLNLNKTATVNAIVGDGVSSKVTADILVNGGALTWGASHQLDDSVYLSITSGTVTIGAGISETLYNLTNSGGTLRVLRGATFTVTDPIWSGGVNDTFGNATYGDLEISGGTNVVHGAETFGVGNSGTLTVGASGLLFSGTASPSLIVSSDDVEAGTLLLNGNVSSTGASGTASIVNGLALQSDGVTPVDGFLGTNMGTVNLGAATRTFTISNGSADVDMAISAQIINGALTKTGLGTLSLSGANTYSGGTNINGGVVQVNSSGALGSSGTITFGGGTLQYTAANTTDYSSRFSTGASQAISIDTNGQDVTFASNLTSSGGSLAKSGAGTLELTGNNTYDLGTTVTAGTLLVNNVAGSGTGTGNVTIDSAATLSGSGIIAPTANNASVSVQGLLNVGNAADTAGADLVIDMSGATGTLVVDLTGGVTLDYFSGQDSGVLNTGLSFNDQLGIVGGGATLNLGGELTFNNFNGLAVNSFTAGSSWKLFAWSGLTTVGSFSNIAPGAIGNFTGFTDLSAELLGWDFTNLYSAGTVSIVVIPEPSRAMLLLLGLLGLGLRRRREGV